MSNSKKIFFSKLDVGEKFIKPPFKTIYEKIQERTEVIETKNSDMFGVKYINTQYKTTKKTIETFTHPDCIVELLNGGQS